MFLCYRVLFKSSHVSRQSEILIIHLSQFSIIHIEYNGFLSCFWSGPGRGSSFSVCETRCLVTKPRAVRGMKLDSLVLFLCTSQIEASTSPRAYSEHLTPFLAPEGGNLITTHRGWGILSLTSMSCYEINCGDGWDVKLWWIQRKRLRICWKPKAYTSCVPYLKVFKNDLYL